MNELYRVCIEGSLAFWWMNYIVYYNFRWLHNTQLYNRVNPSNAFQYIVDADKYCLIPLIWSTWNSQIHRVRKYTGRCQYVNFKSWLFPELHVQSIWWEWLWNTQNVSASFPRVWSRHPDVRRMTDPRYLVKPLKTESLSRGTLHPAAALLIR